MNSDRRNYFLPAVILSGIVVVLVYFYFSPDNNPLFPKCPVYKYLHVKCPGCGSQRAIHHLLHFKIKESLIDNPLVLTFLPYILVGWFLDIPKYREKHASFRKKLYGVNAIYLILTIIILFTILRNTIFA